LTIIVTSLVSWVLRSTELRVGGIVADEIALAFTGAAAGASEPPHHRELAANRRAGGDTKMREASDASHSACGAGAVSRSPGDASQFSEG
jgi:hypothetical protein